MGESVKNSFIKVTRKLLITCRTEQAKYENQDGYTGKKKSQLQSELKLSYQKSDEMLIEIFTCFFLKLTKIRPNHKL